MNVTFCFQIRTLEANGLLLFSSSGVLDKDFLAIELSDGAVRYIFDTGNGAQTLQQSTSLSSRPINDGQWHDIGIQRTELLRQVLVVDDCIVEGSLAPESRSVHFDLNDDVYIGGVPGHMYQVLPKQVKARDGFHGCVASVFFNGKTRNLLDQSTDIPDSVQHLIKGGCEGICCCLFAPTIHIHVRVRYRGLRVYATHSPQGHGWSPAESSR